MLRNARAALHRESIARSPLRFIRSASAVLPSPVQAELERVFNTPVIESYGMTETASQIGRRPSSPIGGSASVFDGVAQTGPAPT